MKKMPEVFDQYVHSYKDAQGAIRYAVAKWDEINEMWWRPLTVEECELVNNEMTDNYFDNSTNLIAKAREPFQLGSYADYGEALKQAEALFGLVNKKEQK